MPLFDDTSFDFDFDEFAGYPSFSIPDIDLSGFDWGNVDFGLGDLDFGGLGNLDLSNLENFGFDLSDLGSVDLSNVESLLNWGADVGLDTILDPFEVDGLQGSRTDIGALIGTDTTGSNLDPYEIDGLQGSRTEDTALIGTETDPYGIDGRQGSRTEDTATTGTTTTTTTPGTNTIKEIIKTVGQFAGNKDNAALMAILGGLLGLLGRQGGGTSAPPGYKGGIPKYMATRGKPGEGTRFVRQAAEGGLMGLRQGRYLGGPTDGMADKIKTDIDGKQPARLSHGEFVIPADVVSHLGNGNSDAGADVLYDMMAKVRKARTGNSKQGKQINPRKYTPA